MSNTLHSRLLVDQPIKKGLNIMTNFYSKILVSAIAILAVFAQWSALAQAQSAPDPVASYAIIAVANAIDGPSKREAFTQAFVNKAQQIYPNYNVVISHNGGQVTVGGAIHQHVELPLFGGTCGYEVYYFPKGQQTTFVRNGDGGYINWAYAGSATANGSTVNFN